MSHLEYAFQFFSFYLKTNIEMLETVQHGVTQFSQDLAGSYYDARLSDLGSYTLHTLAY